MDSDVAAIEAAVEYRFTDSELLLRALTHRSRAFEEAASGASPCGDNEQLEFLGDAILGFLTSELLLESFPEAPEGQLSKRRARVVSASHLFTVAKRLDLGEHLRLGKGEEMSGGRGKKALLANAVEALIAAIYLDGGIEAARSFVCAHVIDGSESGDLETAAIEDSKSALQEWTQARGLPPPRYRVVETLGPEHSKTFVVEAVIGEEHSVRAEGPSKKAAGQRAARELLTGLVSGN